MISDAGNMLCAKVTTLLVWLPKYVWLVTALVTQDSGVDGCLIQPGSCHHH